MADAPAKEAGKESTGDDSAAKKKSPVKMIAIVAVLMIAEAIGVFMFIGATGKQPAEAEAHSLSGETEADNESTVELPLIEEKFQTMNGSQVWIWQTIMALKVKKKNESFVKDKLKQHESEIKEQLSVLFRKAQPAQLREPGLETLNRQVTAYLSRILGKDPNGHERFDRLLIPKCQGFSAN